jgi:nucleoside-diphosphate-sugar epimerase
MTGNRGVIGQQLYKKLIYDGCTVVGSRRLLQKPIKGIDEVVLSPWSIIDLGGFQPDFIIHLAGYYAKTLQNQEIRKITDANVGLAASLADLLLKLKVSVISTGSYSEKYSGPEGINYYAATKIAGKALLAEAALIARASLDYVYLYDTYSTDTSRNKFIDRLLKLKKNSPPLLAGDENQIIDLVYIPDIVQNYIKLLSPDRIKTQLYNEWQIRTGDVLTLRQVAGIVGDIRGFELPISWNQLKVNRSNTNELWDCAPYLNDKAATHTLYEGLSKIISK